MAQASRSRAPRFHAFRIGDGSLRRHLPRAPKRRRHVAQRQRPENRRTAHRHAQSDRARKRDQPSARLILHLRSVAKSEWAMLRPLTTALRVPFRLTIWGWVYT